MMKLKVKMIMMSHLSDVQENHLDIDNHSKINFVKWLILKYPDTNVEIDADAEYQLYLKRETNIFLK